MGGIEEEEEKIRTKSAYIQRYWAGVYHYYKFWDVRKKVYTGLGKISGRQKFNQLVIC